ncbi:MAG: crosslink repair DNA glycosylase YcaQ family protein [Myxococcota bacterium]
MFLSGQGLLDDPQRPATEKSVLATVEALGFVQVDSIASIARAHDLTLAARLFRYKPEHLRRLLEDRRSLFENWTHDAAVIPTRWFTHWKHRFSAANTRIWGNAWWRSRFGRDPEVVLREVEDRVRREGPILARDFEGEGRGNEAGWWNWKPAKAALELLWRNGKLAISRRVNFQKVYDLTERVLPEHHALPPPSWEEHVAWACLGALDRLGFATPRELAAFWAAVPLSEVRAWCARAVGEGTVVEVERGVLAPPDWPTRAARLPEAPSEIRLLAPFDPLVRDRKRALSLFGFNYRFEAFVPAAKRTYGYYVLPMLEGDRLVGRMEPRLQRAARTVEVQGVWWEEGIKPTRQRRARLDDALQRLATLVGARTIVMPRR